MNALPLAATLGTAVTFSTGEAVLFWVLAPVMVLAALGLLFLRKSVYAAMCVVLIMLSLAALYVAQGAPFLGVAQVVVYTGAIMMLFLFVLMLVGVDASDSLTETIRGQRGVAVLGGLGLVLVLVGVVATAVMPDPVGVDAANADTNPVGVARLIFSDHVFTMEITGALLIVAALGAVTLTHGERLHKKLSQADTAEAKMRAYGEGRGGIRMLPAPGVYARSNSAAVAALSGTGEPIQDSVPRVLRIRGQERPIGDVAPEAVEAVARSRAGDEAAGLFGAAASRGVRQSGLPGMRGEPAPTPGVPGDPVATIEPGETAAEITEGEEGR
ncbi:MAG: NADH-quinone oxidoreductase subunit J [Georgenia sp.]